MELHDFLARLQVEHGPNASGEYQCRCPAHDDGTASLCVREGTNREGERCLFVKCQAGCATDAVMAALGLKMADLFSKAKITAIDDAKKPQAARKSRSRGGAGKFVCSYAYTDEAGKVLFEACRYQREDGKKTFKLRQPDASAQDGWRYTKEGVRLVLYRLPEVLAAIQAGRPVFVVEGEKDCDNLAKLGQVATTSPMGAGKWHSGEYSASLTGADLYIIQDNDEPGRKHAQTVAHSTYKLAKAVRILDLTQACPQLQEHGDITDFFKLMGKAEGEKALAQLMREAAPYTGDAQTERDEAAGCYSKVYGYCVDNGCICQETQDGPKRLANFLALPRAVVTRDDGVNITKDMLIDGWTQGGAPLPSVRIKANQYQGMGWVSEHWDFAATIMPGNTVRDKLRYVISEVGAMTVTRTTEYNHTGWRKIAGKWAYLYQGGAIGMEDVTVDLGSGLGAYRLDGSGAVGFEDIPKEAAAIATRSLQDCIAEHVSIPLLGTVFLSPLREFLTTTGIAPAYALFLLGGTGTRKSTAAALALSHFGNFTGKSLPASFNDTANFIRKKAFLLKDAPIVVDDYHPVQSLQERKKMEATAQSLARAFGDGAERGRMRSDLTLQEAMPPRSVAIISGEDTPGVGESGMARFYMVSVGKNDIQANDMLTMMQEQARKGYLQKSMRGYIEWLLEQAEELPERLHGEWMQLRTMAQERTQGQHGRTPEAIAHIMLGYGYMMQYMVSVNAIAADGAAAAVAHAWQVVTDNSKRQSEEMREDRPSKTFLSSISELLTSKAAAVRDLTAVATQGGGIPINMIGYMDQQFYYLMPEVAYRAVAKLNAEQGQAFPLTRKMLYKQMREDGMLMTDTTAHTTTRPKWLDGRTQRLLWVRRELVDGPRVEQEQQQLPVDEAGFAVVEDEENPFEEEE